MKKLVLTLVMAVSIMGCAVGESVQVESKPVTPPRIIVSGDYNLRFGPYVYIITDTKNDIEYLCVRTGNGLSVCPMIQKEVQAEKTL
jgi:hypothetical protein